MIHHYKLEGKEPVPAAPDDYSMYEDGVNRHVALDHVGNVKISTVFLVIDHGWGRGPPILFETMVFGGEHDQEMDRYATWEQAERGHAAMVERVKSKTKLEVK